MSGDASESTEGIEGAENDIDGEEGHRSHRKMFECDVCNMKFSNGANMRRHKVPLFVLFCYQYTFSFN